MCHSIRKMARQKSTVKHIWTFRSLKWAHLDVSSLAWAHNPDDKKAKNGSQRLQVCFCCSISGTLGVWHGLTIR